jgi:hypothetical protein
MNDFDRKRLEALLAGTRAFLEARQTLDKECRTPDPLPESPHHLQSADHKRRMLRLTSVGRLQFDFQKHDPYPSFMDIVAELAVQCANKDSEIFTPDSEFGKLFKRVSQRVHMADASRRAFKLVHDALGLTNSPLSDIDMVARVPHLEAYEWQSTKDVAEGERNLQHLAGAALRPTLPALADLAVLQEAKAMPLVRLLESFVDGLLVTTPATKA